MAGQVSALLKGFDYQHLLSWHHILSLKQKEKKVTSVKLENSGAGSVDDLTVHKDDNSADFYQIKYHTTGGHYSIDTLLLSGKGPSLLEKFWESWKKLIKTYSRDKIRLILYSNWVPHFDDKILACLNGEDGRFTELFFTAGNRTECGKKRKEWQLSHGASDQDFKDFTGSITFLLGSNYTEQLKEMIGERMQNLSLRRDHEAMVRAVDIVKTWIKDKVKTITADILEERIAARDLYQPPDVENAVSVYFVTVKDRKFEIEPDYYLNWQNRFRETGGYGGHELMNPTDWNNVMLPELRALETKLNSETPVRLIKARGYARLSPWFAFGHTFSEVSGYKIEIDQRGNFWRTDEKPNPEFKIIPENGKGEILTGHNKTVAVGISVSGSLEGDVREYLKNNSSAEALLLLRPEKELGNSCFENASDVTAFAKQIKEKIREFVKAYKADKLLLFYFGPLSGACFLGHQLNAVCNEIQIMENIRGGYAESFNLF